VPAVITVTTLLDEAGPDGRISLREAIASINAGMDVGDVSHTGIYGVGDTINFHISDHGLVETINLMSPLPTIVKPVLIDGYSELQAKANTLADGDNANILIDLDGEFAGANANGLTVQIPGANAAVNATIRGLAINRFSDAEIDLLSDFNTVSGNFVGTDAAGNAGQSANSDGIRINNASNNLIGGTSLAARNLVGGTFGGGGSAPRQRGIAISGMVGLPATNNVIEGNFVGVNAAGTGPSKPHFNFFSNEIGIDISGGNANTIGGNAVGAGNVIGANTDGIELDNGAQGNVVQGNLVGVGADGVSDVGNYFHGIALRSDGNLPSPLGPGQANEPPVQDNLIGGTVAGAGNLIEFNGLSGVAVFGNPLPNNPAPAPNIGNAILGNSIFLNGRPQPGVASGIGIDLANQNPYPYPDDVGVTPNDARGHGANNDPNNFENFPVLTSGLPANAGTTFTGSLHSTPSTNGFRLEFFASDPDPLDETPEGQTFLGFGNVNIDATGTANFSITVPGSVTPGQIVTATATDPTGNTSEFSPGIYTGTASQIFIIKVYHQLLGRMPDPGGLAGWSSLVDQGISPSQVVLNIETDINHEYYSRLVQSCYQQYLKRAIGPSDGNNPAAMVAFLADGGTIEQLRAMFTQSVEFLNTQGNDSNSGFINALYQAAFTTPNRLATDPGAIDFKEQLDSQTATRASVSSAVFSSWEFQYDTVQGFYHACFHRTGSDAEVAGWVDQLGAGATDQQILANMMGSVEYYGNSGL
jgi:hypothetical protein